MKGIGNIAVVLAVLMMAGCADQGKGKKNSQGQKGIEIETVRHSARGELHDGSEDALTLEMSIEWPEGGMEAEALKNMQREITGLIFGSDAQTTDLEYAIRQHCDSSIEFYREENSPYLDDDDQEWAYTFQWYEKIEGRFTPPYDGMISYINCMSGYSGGAHGMDTRNAIVLDEKTGRRISETEIFKPGYEQWLTRALRANLLISVEDPELLFETDIVPNGNFFVSDKGMTYIYGRYEVGPYVLGIVEVNIPWDELSSIMK